MIISMCVLVALCSAVGRGASAAERMATFVAPENSAVAHGMLRRLGSALEQRDSRALAGLAQELKVTLVAFRRTLFKRAMSKPLVLDVAVRGAPAPDRAAGIHSELNLSLAPEQIGKAKGQGSLNLAVRHSGDRSDSAWIVYSFNLD